MTFLKNYSKSIGFSILSIFILTFLITLLNYIGILGIKIVTAFSYITPFISFMIGGILLGKKSNKKGWLEGIKLGLIINILLFIFNFLAFNHGYTLPNLILYAIVFIASILGSMIGINLKK